MKYLAILLTSIFFFSGIIWAQDEAMDDDTEVGLEEFLDMKIITATQTEQTIAEAPAIISVLTAEQIKNLGITTLYEALDYLPGIQVTESYFGYTMVNMRGVLETHYNNKVLLMINGHPMREVVNGSFHLEIIPIEAILRIEVVRGPGSSLYGTNAFAGVINIITKTGKDYKRGNIKLGSGSFDTLEAAASVGHKYDNISYSLNVSTRNDNGYPFDVVEDEKGESGTINYENDVSNVWASIEFHGITFSGAYFKQSKQKFGITPVLNYTGINEFEGGFIDILGKFDFTDTLKLTSRLRYDNLDRNFHVGHFPYDGFEGHKDATIVMQTSGDQFGAELQLDYNAISYLSLLGGIVFENANSAPYRFIFDDDGSLHPFTPYENSYNENSISVYGQGILSHSDWAQFILGLRFNNNSDSGASLAPRIGMVFKVFKNTYLKAFYSEAYRSPDFFEKHVSTYNVLYGSTDLEPENMRSFDVAVDTKITKRLKFRVDGFYLETDNLITRMPTDNPDLTGPNAAMYINAKGENISGIETEVLFSLGKAGSFFFNYSYRYGEDADTGENIPFIAKNTANAGLNWKMLSWLSFNPNLQYVSSRKDVDEYFLANLSFDFDISDYFSFSIIGRNLTDENYSYPEYIRNIIPEIPGGPGRSFYFRASWRF